MTFRLIQDDIQVISNYCNYYILKIYYVYILKCSDNSYYTGVTNDVERRVAEHNEGEDTKAYTYRRRPVKLVWLEDFNDIQQAIEKEKQIKGWNRKKKEALINDDFDLILALSNLKNNTKRNLLSL